MVDFLLTAVVRLGIKYPWRTADVIFMNSLRFSTSSTRRLLSLALPVCIFSNVVVAECFSFQSKTIVSDRGSNVLVSTYPEIPEATEPCTPKECEWWKQLRQAGNDVQKKGGEQSKKRFAVLFLEGLQRGYRVPLKDRPPHVLAYGRVMFSPIRIERARAQRMNKTAVLSLEFRADGSVGDIKLVKELGSGMDENVIQAARQNIFIPAIRNGVFTTEWHNTEFKFSTKR